jgi:hypothetical protein
LQPGTPRDLTTICLKCLEKDPHRRYPSAAALADDLDRFLAGRPILARPAGAVERSWKWARRQPALAALAALIVLIAFVGLPVVTGLWFHARRGWDRAEAASRETSRALYASYVHLASAALEGDDVEAADDWLARCRQLEGSADLLGWEYHYLDRRCHADLVGPLNHAANEFWVQAVCWHPEGRLLSGAGPHPWKVAGRDPPQELVGSLKAWDPRTGRCLGTWVDHPQTVCSVAVSPDGRRVATASLAGDVCLRDGDTLAVRSRLPEFKGEGRAGLLFAPDSRRLAVVTQTDVRLWEAPGSPP